MKINKYIEHTLLKPTASEKDITKLCKEAKQYDFYSVCINSYYVPLAKELLKMSSVKIVSVIGFPLGAMSTESKIFEAKNAIENGADEIDMVINLGALKSKNYIEVYKDLSEIKLAIGLRTPLKVIIEISELSKNEIVKAIEICLDAKIDFIKTSTGFSKKWGNINCCKNHKKTVKSKAKIKASGGINTNELVQKYINAGADRIGTSSGIDIVKTLQEV